MPCHAQNFDGGSRESTDFEELVPILAGPGQPGHLDTADQPDMIETHLGNQALKAEPRLGRAATQSDIIIDDENTIGMPPQNPDPFLQAVLEACGLLVAHGLLDGRLSHIDNRETFQVPVLDLL